MQFIAILLKVMANLNIQNNEHALIIQPNDILKKLRQKHRRLISITYVLRSK